MDGILGPISTNPMYFKEDFTYEEITKFGGNGEVVEEYHAKVAHRLCEFIDQVTLKDGGKKNYFCICIPCYNESMDDLMKTVLCLLENIDFMKHEGKKFCCQTYYTFLSAGNFVFNLSFSHSTSLNLPYVLTTIFTLSLN